MASVPPPAIVDASGFEFGVYSQHIFADEIAYVGREPAAIRFSAAEEHAIVGGQFPVVDDKQAVGHGRVVSNQASGQCFRQRFGGQHVVVNGHNAPGGARFQFFQITVAGQHQVLGLYRTAIRFHAYLMTLSIRKYPGYPHIAQLPGCRLPWPDPGRN